MNKLIVPDYVKKEEEDAPTSNVVPFLQPVTGGKDPKNNWLADLEIGSVFLCVPRTQKGQVNLFALEYHVVWHTDGETKLLDNINEEKYFWVITKNFSEAFEHLRTLVERDPPTQQEE